VLAVSYRKTKLSLARWLDLANTLKSWDFRCMKKRILGKSTQGRDLECFVFESENPNAKNFVLMGGFHGDEPEGVWVVEHFLNSEMAKEFKEANLYVIPQVNPDGVAASTRVNANGVDLNRNFPTVDWNAEAREAKYNPGAKALSEIEAQIMHDFILEVRPILFISCHCYIPQVNVNGDCKEASVYLSEKTKYPVTRDVGYTTPGCFGQWVLEAIGTPSITLEIEERMGKKLAVEKFPQHFVETFRRF